MRTTGAIEKVMPDYSSVTETDEAKLTTHALAMNYHRYRFARDYCGGKEVLEVACGNGQGLGYLARTAARVVGGDCTEKLVRKAQSYYGNRLSVHWLDAHSLPFEENSFDVVILFEAIYYLERPEVFLGECRRILRDGGTLLISTVNREWAEFNPSPMSHKYFEPLELVDLLSAHGFRTSLLGAFPVEIKGRKDALVSLAKRLAVKLHLVPRSMKGKEFLKKLFYGKLTILPPELTDGMTGYEPPLELDGRRPTADYRVVYAVGSLNEGRGKAR